MNNNNYFFSTVGNEEAYLSVIPDSLTFGSNGGSQSVVVQSNISWVIMENLSWVTVSPMSGKNGGTLTVTVDSNYDFERSGSIKVMEAGGTIRKSINVFQQGI